MAKDERTKGANFGYYLTFFLEMSKIESFISQLENPIANKPNNPLLNMRESSREISHSASTHSTSDDALASSNAPTIDLNFLNQLENPLKFAAYKNRYSSSFLLSEEQKKMVKDSWEALLAVKETDEDGNALLSGITIFFEYVSFVHVVRAERALL